MSAVNWQDPPRKRAGKGGGILAPDVLASLRANPGRWALVCDDIANSAVTLWRGKHPDLEFTTRVHRDRPHRCAAYARAREVTP